MTTLTVRHVTTYRYKRLVSFGKHRMMFRPRDSYDQILIEARLDIAPEPERLDWHHDVFGNCVTVARFAGMADTLRFESNIRLDHLPSAAPDFQVEKSAKVYPFSYHPEEIPDLAPSIVRQYADQNGEVERWARRFVRVGRPTPTGELLMTMASAVKESFIYERRLEKGTQTPAFTLKHRRGTCRDFALLMIEAARSLGLAARFVTGYVYVPSRDGPTHLGGGSTHAWCQVYLPGAGWVEFDPTNGIVGNRDLIRVAVARDPSQAVPLSGTWTGLVGDYEGMTVEVDVKSVGAALPAEAGETGDRQRSRTKA
jgi:transglutaminase-like putative cysteine protease